MATPPYSDSLTGSGSDDDDIPEPGTNDDTQGEGLPRALQNLQQVVANSVRDQSNFSTSLTAAALAGMHATTLGRLVLRFISTLTDRVFRSRLLRAVGLYIQEHPYIIAFVVIGLVLAINPLALAGFGALGPVAGSIAAGWQASIAGSVAAGSVFSILQGLGMAGAVAIPATGAGITGGALLVAWVRSLWEDE